jgi:hypothetical protein
MNARPFVGIGLLAAAIAVASAAPAGAEEAALSLVHWSGRVDFLAKEIRRVSARRSRAGVGPQASVVHRHAYVEICFTKKASQRLCALTRRIVGEPAGIMVGCELVAAPVILEPLCAHPCFAIDVYEPEEAERLARSLREQPRGTCPTPFREAGTPPAPSPAMFR